MHTKSATKLQASFCIPREKNLSKQASYNKWIFGFRYEMIAKPLTPT